MEPRQQILRYLLTSPSTASAITDHTDIPTPDVIAILRDEEIAGTIESHPLKMLTVWSLTSAGSAIAHNLPPAPTKF